MKKFILLCSRDILVVCDEAKLDEKGCVGAPDLIIEIVSLYLLRYGTLKISWTCMSSME
jgi:Uma2 family endonuclease